jgi:hypothetical protein
MKTFLKLILFLFFFNSSSQVNQNAKTDTLFVFFKAKKNQTLTISNQVAKDKSIVAKYYIYNLSFQLNKYITLSHIELFKENPLKDAKKFDIKKINKSFLRKNKDKVLSYNLIKNGNFEDYVNLLLYKNKTVYIIDKSEKKNGIYTAREVWVSSSLESE